MWHIFPRFGMLHQGKCGNPADLRHRILSKEFCKNGTPACRELTGETKDGCVGWILSEIRI
jgi:hypothetical protein